MYAFSSFKYQTAEIFWTNLHIYSLSFEKTLISSNFWLCIFKVDILYWKNLIFTDISEFFWLFPKIPPPCLQNFFGENFSPYGKKKNTTKMVDDFNTKSVVFWKKQRGLPLKKNYAKGSPLWFWNLEFQEQRGSPLA